MLVRQNRDGKFPAMSWKALLSLVEPVGQSNADPAPVQRPAIAHPPHSLFAHCQHNAIPASGAETGRHAPRSARRPGVR